jgi:hypothetical protein
VVFEINQGLAFASEERTRNLDAKHYRSKEDELTEGLDVLTDPLEDWGKAEFVPVEGGVDECVSV